MITDLFIFFGWSMPLRQ